ncbi:MAG TPA: hypothetical protein VLE21_03510 [Candidatus Nitrosocosmicus sp.]|nr:hypothetical protein [Candidatus Nitrosocosmicus sp.]
MFNNETIPSFRLENQRVWEQQGIEVTVKGLSQMKEEKNVGT